MKMEVSFKEQNQSFDPAFVEVYNISDDSYQRGYADGYEDGLAVGVGDLSKYVKIIAKPASSTVFTIENPLGGVAKKVYVKRTTTAATSSRKIHKYIADFDFEMGVLYAIASDGGARYTVKKVESSANNGEFAITDGKIVLYRYNSANTWDNNSEYEVEIYE